MKGSKISLAICLLASSVLAQGPTAIKEYAIPNHGTLRLSIPDEWQSSSKSIQSPASTAIHITPKGGDGFDLQLTAVWLEPTALGKVTAQSIKANVQNAANTELQQAVEKTASIQEVRGAQSMGSYFTLTDRNPAPGEFKYLTQGSSLTGEVVTAFTILSRAPADPNVSRTIRMIGDANYSK